MIANELERVVVEYLAEAIQVSQLGIVPDISQPGGPTGPFEITFPDGKNVRVYRGEGNTDIKLPAVIASCDSTEQDNETGNATCALSVLVRYQADDATDNKVPLDELLSLSSLVFDAMLRKDIVARLNRFAGNDFTCIAFITQSPAKLERDRMAEHMLTCSSYCAATNLLTA